MTYCVGMLVDAGMVFLADSRTNAGVDQISTFRKVTVFERPGERVMVLMSAGNLAISQALNNILRARIDDGATESLFTAPDMFEATRHIGEALREIHKRDAEALKDHNVEFNASLIFGGQIGHRAAATVLYLCSRQFHRSDRRYALFPDRRIEVWQADHRPRRLAQHQPGAGCKVRADIHGFHDPFESVGRPAARSVARASRRFARAQSHQHR